MLSDEMVSADFVDDLVLAEDDETWAGEQATAGPAPKPADDEPRRGRRRRRRRGGQRSREGSEPTSRGGPREFDDEQSDETDHIEEIVDAIEASPIAEPDDREPLEEAVAAQSMHDQESDEDRTGKRRRRRRGRRRDSQGDTGNETPRRETGRGEMGRGEMGRGEMGRGEMGRGEMGRGEPDTELDESDDVAVGYDAADDSDGDLDSEHGDDQDGHEGRPSHRAIPSWDEAIGVIVSANLESRAKNPHSGGSPRGRGRGQRGGRGRRP